MNPKRTFLTVAAAAALAAAGVGAVGRVPWFSQTFSGLANGTPFTGKTGATGGGWLEPIPEGVATVATVGGRSCIDIDTSRVEKDEIQFRASNALARAVCMDFSICTSPFQVPPALQAGDWGALCLLSTNQVGVRVFGGYAQDGWKELYGRGLSEHRDDWLDCRAVFEYATNSQGRIASAFVTYYSRLSGDEYVPLATTDGISRFEVATNVIRSIVFSGTGLVGEFGGSGLEVEEPRVCTWTGPTGSDIRWENPDNWSGKRVPGDGDVAQVPAGTSIEYGKYTFAFFDGACSLSIVSNVSVRISPWGTGAGQVAVSCEDHDYTSLGTVYVDAGLTLLTCGTYAGLEMAFGSKLKLVESVGLTIGLTITDRRFFLDGVTLDVSEMTAAAGVKEGRLAISAPYGSGGVPARLLAATKWTAAWHDRLDGGANLWLVNGNYSGTVAVWNGIKNSELADRSNWSPAPGPSVAALIGSGATQMSGGNPQVFEFARWFDIGHAGEGELFMHKGDFTVRGNKDKDKGGAVLVGSDGGRGVLDIVGGLVRPYDYLWNYALTIGSGTNATGSVTVCGGMVDAVGGSVSVGADGLANMAIEKGTVSVGDALGVGYSGTLDVSGGLLAVSNSLFIGRAARSESYDVKMTVSAGTVSNLAAGAIWIGSYGGFGSKAALSLTGGKVCAAEQFVCGGYRSASVDVCGGVLAAPNICIGHNLADAEEVASFQLVSGRVETAGFTSGTNGVRTLVLAGGELVATTTNDDFFAGLDVVRLAGDTVLDNECGITITSALTGPGDFVKAGPGTNTLAGYSAWAGNTIVSNGVLDLGGGMVMGELVIGPDASVINVKYDEVDELFPFLQKEFWTSGTPTTRSFAYVDFAMAADGLQRAEALDGVGVKKGAMSSVADGETRAFLGWTALGWTTLGFSDRAAVEEGVSYELRMLFDFRAGKPYVAYYARRDTGWERLVSPDGLTAFPVAGAAGITTFSGPASYTGMQLYMADGSAFYWIGPDGGEWNDGNNWSNVPGGEKCGGYPKATGDYGSLAFVERPASISIGSAAKTALLMVNDNVRLSGGQALTVSSAISGVGQLSLSGVTLHSAGAGVPVDVPVVAEAGTANRFMSMPPGSTFVLNGPLRGAGEIALTALDRRPMGGSVLAGDNAEFGGTVKIYPYWRSKTDHQQLDKPSIATPQASSAAASWEINVEHAYPKTMKPGVEFFGTAYATYRFGSLKANFYYADEFNAYWAKDGVTLEVGALDRDGYALGKCAGSGGVIDWVAPTATFTSGVSGLSALRLSGGGKLVIPSADAVPLDAITFADRGGELLCDVNTNLSAFIVNSTAPVVFNGGDIWCQWEAPDASNVGGFVKRGTGTLEWTNAPSFRMDVAVEEGTLIVPFGTQLGRVSVSRGATLAVDCMDAVRDALVFSADASACRMQEPELQFINVPEDYEITIVYGDENAIVAKNGGSQFVWTGAAGNDLWATPANWLVNKKVPDRFPRNLDRVRYGSGSYLTCLDRPAAAMTLDSSEDPCDIVFAGSFALDVLLQFELSGVLDLRPNPMAAGSSSADYYGARTNVLGVSSVAAFSAATVRGKGFVSAGDKDLIVSPSGSAPDRFVGTLCAGKFVKRGGGTFEFIGDGAFSGGVSVEQGTLRLGSYRDMDGIRMDFDASDTNSLELAADGVDSWRSRVGQSVFDYADGQKAVPTSDYFGGRRAVMLRPNSQGKAYSRYDLSPANAPGDVSRSLFVVYDPGDFADGYLYAQRGDSERSLCREARQEGSPWYCPKAGFGANGIFTGVDYGSKPTTNGVPTLTFWSDTALAAGAKESLGTAETKNGFCGAVGEVVAFTNTLTHVERDVVSRLLMNKWGVPGCAEFAPIHTNAPVVMRAGATLDLGGQTMRVGSFSGAGTITNGVLLTADDTITQSGGALSVPAVEGMTYVASSAGQKLIIRDAPGVTVRIVLPKGWFSAGNTGRRAIFCESNRIEWDVWRRDVRPVSEGDGWWSIAGGGFAVRLR